LVGGEASRRAGDGEDCGVNRRGERSAIPPLKKGTVTQLGAEGARVDVECGGGGLEARKAPEGCARAMNGA